MYVITNHSATVLYIELSASVSSYWYNDICYSNKRSVTKNSWKKSLQMTVLYRDLLKFFFHPIVQGRQFHFRSLHRLYINSKVTNAQWSWHLIKSKTIILVSSLRSTIINLAREESYDILLKKISTPIENIRVGRQDASPIFLLCFCLKIGCCNVIG